MAMSPREVVSRTVRFQGADRFPVALPGEHGSDIYGVGMTPSTDYRPSSGVDEWGCVWNNIGVSKLGEVKDFPIKDWPDWPRLHIPDIREERRWASLQADCAKGGDKFVMGAGVSLYERVHFVRGLENTWCDIHTAPQELGRLIDVLVEMNLYAVERYAAAGVNGLMFWDDWGLQDRLMINPESWRAIWKPRYARVYAAAHQAGLLTFLHSCGNITTILDDLIEAGLDVIQMDQQENMGPEALGARFGGRLAFWCPVDIQQTMVRGSLDDIRAYCGRLVRTLGRPEGGFIAGCYADPVGAGHRPEAVQAECEEFVRLSKAHGK